MNENSNCGNNTFGDYFKMGSWDGRMTNGTNAPLGTYVYKISYNEGEFSEVKNFFGLLTLVR